MASTEERGVMDRWMYRVGYARELIDGTLERARSAATGSADPAERPLPPRGGEAPGEGDELREAATGAASAAASTALAGVILGRLIHPASVNWPRAILAGTIGTLLYDAETLVETRLRNRKFGTRRSTASRGPLAGRVRATAARYAAGIGMASLYARFVYGRLPAPAVAQGIAYALLEAATRGQGGTAALLNRLAPELGLPSVTGNGIARPDDTPGEAIRRHALFGLALGIVYRR